MRQPALRGLQNRLLKLSSDYETLFGSGSLLVVAPHPDDESIGCGGLIALARRTGVDVQIVFVTDGEASHRSTGLEPDQVKGIRRREAIEAARRLGVPQAALHFLGFPDMRVKENRDAIVASLFHLLQSHKPQAVFLPHKREPPPDHYFSYVYGRMALDIWAQPVRLFEYGVWYWQHWPWVPLQFGVRASSRLKWRQSMARGFGVGAFSEYNCHLNISELLPLKKSALAAHASQFDPDFGKAWPALGDLENGLIVQSWLQPIESFRMTQLSGLISNTRLRPGGRGSAA